MEHFEIISEIRQVETIAIGHGIRDLAILEKRFGNANWRKLKSLATVRLEDGTVTEAEVTLVRSTRHRKTVDQDQALP